MEQGQSTPTRTAPTPHSLPASFVTVAFTPVVLHHFSAPSIMSSANFGRKLSPNLGKVWNDVSAYPVIACIVGALYWSTYVGGKYLVTSPDVFWSRDQRSNAIVREDTQEAENWGKRHKSWSIEKDQLKDLRVGYAPARAEPRA